MTTGPAHFRRESVEGASAFCISIGSSELNGAKIDIDVEIVAGHPVITAVRLVSDNGDFLHLPSTLGEVDFAACVDLARELTSTHLNLRDIPATPSPIPPPTTSAMPANVPPEPHSEGGIRKDHGRGASSAASRSGAPPDLGAMYWRLGSATKVAKHYDVPNSVARDWIRELRGGSAWRR